MTLKRKIKKMTVAEIVASIVLIVLAATCLFPFLNMFALSFSDKQSINQGLVTLWPKGWNVDAYKYILSLDQFWKSLWISIKRVLIGVPLNIILAIVTAYPLSKTSSKFKSRTIYIWILFITMLISGGIVPWYFLLVKLKMIDSFWALVLPGAVPVYSVILLSNFYRQLPKALEEAAVMDGANHFQILTKIYVPLSGASIATITLFSLVWHWNSWFDGMLLNNDIANYPLASYFQYILVGNGSDHSGIIALDKVYPSISAESIRAAGVIISIIPIIVSFPFVQKHFKKGIVVGSVKE